MEDCIFCKIVAGEIKTEFVYEDDSCVAFRDIKPKAKTHFLIIPREHISSIADLGIHHKELMGHLLYVAKLIADQFALKGYNLQINVGKDGGQEVFHIHIHLLSKY